MRAVVFAMVPSTPWTDGAFAVLLAALRWRSSTRGAKQLLALFDGLRVRSCLPARP